MGKIRMLQKKGQIMHGKTVPFYFSEKLKKWNFTQDEGYRI